MPVAIVYWSPSPTFHCEAWARAQSRAALTDSGIGGTTMVQRPVPLR